MTEYYYLGARNNYALVEKNGFLSQFEAIEDAMECVDLHLVEYSSYEKLEQENAELRAKLEKAKEALIEINNSYEVIFPIIDHASTRISDFEDFYSNCAPPNSSISKEQREWNELVYKAFEHLESDPAKRVLKELGGE